MSIRRRVATTIALLSISLSVLPVTGAGAHSGGTDSSGGHYCREAGYESGSCGPLDSYHSHNAGGTSGGSSGGGTSTPKPSISYRPAPSADSGRNMRARRMLSRIDTAPERKAWSYYREAFPHWIDGNNDGCDTRQAVLISESRVRASRSSTTCAVSSGVWVSPYDGARWTNPSDVDIDHLVALSEAWKSGAHGWSRNNRKNFANDLRFRPSLVAVTDNVNQSKSDRDPAEWLPSRARCAYAISWVQVKYRWRLKMDRAEKAQLTKMFSTSCGTRVVDVPMRAR